MKKPKPLPEQAILAELEPTVADNLNRHLPLAVDWHPHDYIPWSEGRNFAMLGGEDWDPMQSQLSDVARASLIVGLLTEDNLPTYHRELAANFGLDDAWGHWVNRWTAEEDRHAIAIRDYLVVTREVDPVKLERDRMSVMSAGLQIPTQGSAALSPSRTRRSKSSRPGSATATPAWPAMTRSPIGSCSGSRRTRTYT